MTRIWIQVQSNKLCCNHQFFILLSTLLYRTSLVTIDVPMRKKKCVKTEEDFVPLPDPFPLPKHYPCDVEVALKRGKMTTRERQKFLTEVASAMLRYKRYPSSEDRYCVARSIVDKYPFLKSKDAKPYVSNYVADEWLSNMPSPYCTQDALVRSLINRFKGFNRKPKERKPKISNSSATLTSKPISPGITCSVINLLYLLVKMLSVMSAISKLCRLNLRKVIVTTGLWVRYAVS